MADNFWLNNKQWAAIEPHLPMVHSGPERKDDRRVISGRLSIVCARAAGGVRFPTDTGRIRRFSIDIIAGANAVYGSKYSRCLLDAAIRRRSR